MAHAIIDRRKNSKGKSSVSRKKFLDKVRGVLKESVRKQVRDTNIKDLTGGNQKVRIPIRDLDEPYFHHDDTGIRDIVVPGNDQFVVGDKIKRQKSGEGGGGSKGSPDGEGDDAFVFHLSKEEFLELFFENCQLPDMVKKNLAIVNEEELRRTGISSDGSPSALNVERSMRQAKTRRFALRAMKQRRLKQLEDQVELYKQQGVPQQTYPDLLHEIETLKKQIKAVPFIDPMDLKYNHWSKVSLPTVQAVVFHLMDVSGSMTEHMKEMAKTFYLLLYLFLERHYTHIDIVYVKYHSEARETDEQDFFYGTESGGTVTSKGLQTIVDIVNERYPTSLWNIYVAHASDGDNFEYDNPNVKKILTEDILPMVQYYAYIQVEDPDTIKWSDGSDNLWSLFRDLSERYSNINCEAVAGPEDVYPVFVKLFEKK